MYIITAIFALLAAFISYLNYKLLIMAGDQQKEIEELRGIVKSFTNDFSVEVRACNKTMCDFHDADDEAISDLMRRYNALSNSIRLTNLNLTGRINELAAYFDKCTIVSEPEEVIDADKKDPNFYYLDPVTGQTITTAEYNAKAYDNGITHVSNPEKEVNARKDPPLNEVVGQMFGKENQEIFEKLNDISTPVPTLDTDDGDTELLNLDEILGIDK